MENRTKPSPSPRPLPRGEGEPANASSRFGECRLRSHASKLGAKAARPTLARPNALAHPALPDEPSGSPSPLGRGRGEGEGISLSFRAFFSAVGSGLNSTENSEEPFVYHMMNRGSGREFLSPRRIATLDSGVAKTRDLPAKACSRTRGVILPYSHFSTCNRSKG
jgi:hypothetical protein